MAAKERMGEAASAVVRTLKKAWREISGRPSLWVGLGGFQFWLVVLYSESWLFKAVALGPLERFPSHAVPLAVIMGTLLVAAVVYRRCGRLALMSLGVSAVAALSGCGAALCSVAMVTWDCSPLVSSFALLTAGSVCMGVGVIWGTVATCEVFGRLGSKTAMLFGGLATLFPVVLIALFHDLSAVGDAVVLVVVAPVSLALIGRAAKATLGSVALVGERPAPCPKIPAKLVVTAGVQGFSYGALYLTFPLVGATRFIFASDMAGLLLAALFLVGTVFVANLNYDRLLYLGTFVVIGVAYLLALLVDGGLTAVLTIKNAGYAALDIAVIGVSAYLVHERRLPAVWVALCPSVAVFAGQLACELLSYGALLGLYGARSLYALEMFVLLASALYLSNMRGPDASWGSVAPGDDCMVSDRLMRSCRLLAERCGLTDRELDVLALLAAGRTKRPIAERLVVSVDTAKTHIANIYRKLGVHSQQELIELVEDIE